MNSQLVIIGWILLFSVFFYTEEGRSNPVSYKIDYESCNYYLSSLRIRNYRIGSYIQIIDNWVTSTKNTEISDITNTFDGAQKLKVTTTVKTENLSHEFYIYRNDSGLISKITEIDINKSGRESFVRYHFYLNYNYNKCEVEALIEEDTNNKTFRLRFERGASLKVDRVVRKYGKSIMSCLESDLPCEEEFGAINSVFLSIKVELLNRYKNDPMLLNSDQSDPIFEISDREIRTKYLYSMDLFIEKYLRAYKTMDLINRPFGHPFHVLKKWRYGAAVRSLFYITDFN